MAESLLQLRKRAKAVGVPTKDIRAAESASELRDMIAEQTGDSKPRPTKKRVAKKATARKPARKASRPASSGRPAKRAAQARKPATRKPTPKNDESKRNVLEGVDFSEMDGWNPREGSAPDRIVKALRKAKGNRARAFEALKADVWDFVRRKKTDGSRRTKQEAEDMLRYRISRTAWQFAIATDQHEVAEGRAEYGTAGTGQGIYRRNGTKGRKAAQKATTRARVSKATRKPATRQKAAQKPTGAKRGRPVGSKNKPKPATRRKVTRRAVSKR
jgi:hypothetical protein